ncbi:MAG TPA: ABC transporter permease [Acidimicrobiia bacterium]|nr:ABC transporter permease [Acidimicrobiia bacterium]
MRSTLLIAGKDLRLRLRDRSAIIVGVVVPFVLAAIFSLILGSVEDGPIDLRLGFVDSDQSALSTRFSDALAGLQSEGLLELVLLADAPASQASLDAGDVGAVIVIPRGFEAAVESGQSAQIDVLGDVDRPTSSAIAHSISRSFAASIEGVRLVAATASAVGADVAEAVTAVQTAPPAVVVEGVEASDRQLDMTTFFVAGMAVFFLFFTVQFGVTSLLDEKREGTMSRLLAAPIGRGSIVAAKGLVSLILGIVSTTVLIVASTVLLDANWGDPLGVALLVVAGVVSAVGIMAVVAAFARTPEGAGNLQAVIAVGLGMLGGVFFPTPLGGGILGNLALATPHRWFMTGLGDLAGGGGIGVVLPAVGALVAFGVVTGVIAGFKLRKAVLT